MKKAKPKPKQREKIKMPTVQREGLLIDDQGMIQNLDPSSYLQRREERIAQTITGEFTTEWNKQSLLVANPGTDSSGDPLGMVENGAFSAPFGYGGGGNGFIAHHGVDDETDQPLPPGSLVPTPPAHPLHPQGLPPSSQVNNPFGKGTMTSTGASRRQSLQRVEFGGRRKSVGLGMGPTSKLIALAGGREDDFLMEGAEQSVPLRRRQSVGGRRGEDSMTITGAEAVFRETPPAVATKIASFVGRYVRPEDQRSNGAPSAVRHDANWQTISDMIDTFKKAEKHAQEIQAAVKDLQVSASSGIPSTLFKAQIRKKSKEAQSAMINSWEEDINVALSLMDNLFSFVTAFTPALESTCATVRRSIYSAVFSEGSSFAEACAMQNVDRTLQDSTRQSLIRKVNVYMMHSFGVDQARAEFTRRQAERKSGMSPQNEALLAEQGVIVESLAEQRRFKKRTALFTDALKMNMTCWREQSLRFIFRAWHRECKLTKESASTGGELTRLRGEVELLSRKAKDADRRGLGGSQLSASEETSNANIELQRELSVQHREFIEEANKLKAQNDRLIAQNKLLQEDGKNQESTLKAQLSSAWNSLQESRDTLAKTESALQAAEGNLRTSEASERSMAGTNAELSVILSSVLDSLGDGIGTERELLNMLVHLSAEKGGIVALAHWVTCMASRTFDKDIVQLWLSSTARETRRGMVLVEHAGIKMTVSDDTNITLPPPGPEPSGSVVEVDATNDEDVDAHSSSESGIESPLLDAQAATREASRVDAGILEAQTPTVGDEALLRASQLTMSGQASLSTPSPNPSASATLRDPDSLGGTTNDLNKTDSSAGGLVNGLGVSEMFGVKPRIIDFTEGAVLLDSYAAALHAVDAECISVDDALRVFSEVDIEAKADIVLELGDRLISEGGRNTYCGGLLHKPSLFVSTDDLTVTGITGRAKHSSFVVQLVLYWMAQMSRVDAPSFISTVSKTSSISRTPQEWLRELKTVSQRFESWRYGFVALTTDLVDAQRSLPLAVMSPIASPSSRSTAVEGGASRTPSQRSTAAGEIFDATVAEVSPNTKTRRAEEKMLIVHSWTKSLTLDLLRQIDGGRRDDEPTEAHFAIVEEVYRVVRNYSHVLSSVFRFYATLSVDANPVLVIGPTEAYKMTADMGLSGMISREEMREIFQMLNGSRKRLADSYIAFATSTQASTATTPRAMGLGEALQTPSNTNHTNAIKTEMDQRIQRQFQLTVEEFVPLLCRVCLAICTKKGSSAANAGGAAATLSKISTSSDLAPEFSAFVSGTLINAALLDTESVQQETKAPVVKRMLDQNKKMLHAVFSVVCATDARLEPRGVISQASFAQLITEMGCLDETGVSFVSVNATFIHALQVEFNKPMLMCYSEFLVALVAIACMKYPSPFVQVPIKVSRFMAQFVHPYHRKKCLGIKGVSSSSGPAGASSASLTAGTPPRERSFLSSLANSPHPSSSRSNFTFSNQPNASFNLGVPTMMSRQSSTRSVTSSHQRSNSQEEGDGSHSFSMSGAFSGGSQTARGGGETTITAPTTATASHGPGGMGKGKASFKHTSGAASGSGHALKRKGSIASGSKSGKRGSMHKKNSGKHHHQPSSLQHSLSPSTSIGEKPLVIPEVAISSESSSSHTANPIDSGRDSGPLSDEEPSSAMHIG